MLHHSKTTSAQSGQLLILVLVFGAVFLIIVSSFITSVATQARAVDVRFEQQRATEIAEAGLNYYKWYLAHFPGDVGGSGTYVYEDPEDGAIGTYELAISGNSYCGQISSIEVTSTGRTYANANAYAVVSATYKRPTVAEYSFVTNGGVWFGGGTLVGPVHSNQGLRMEAAHNSTISSGQPTWNCDYSYGCNPEIPAAPGVYSSGSLSNPGLFQFPVSPIDFAGLTLDLAGMKSRAQNNGGIYYGRTSGFGYLVTFNGNNTINVDRVTRTRRYWSYNSTDGWTQDERNVITRTTRLATNQAIDSACPVLFFEDKTWIQGDINQKVTIAAGDLAQNAQTNIVINDDLRYVSGTDAGLLAIAEDDVDINLVIPGENLDLHGIYIAQKGRFGRDGYVTYSWPRLPSNLRSYAYLNNLSQLGTQVSNTRSVVNWIGWSGFAGSGGASSFDRDQIDNPPPLTPETSDVYELQDWRSAG